jgi:hypothetical protein
VTVEEIVADWERRMLPGVTWDWDETFGLLKPADLVALIADWRKRGEALAALADSEKVEPCWRLLCSHALAR